ncbi:Mobile element protein [uncultured Synechococcales cyanobacterium]|uniref:Mobile element protein n=1 Tax=uncultured Synechococcales cyanobacterium TaxID=1936017 RepID=A0A6J4VLW8_9CYAN|nr:Mobile element protein [uncultured Synechococcales cyanobacterium]
MKKPDARLLNPTTQNYLRQQAIRLREQGKRMGEIANYLGVHRTTVSGWWRQYQQEGETALKQQPRGAKLGEGRTLSLGEETTVQRLMQAHFPDELNIDSALWTRSAVQALIACECGVEMPIRTVGEYLLRWGYTPQKPLKRAYEQDPQAVSAWLETDYPAIKQRAQQQDAEIAWGDESGLRSDAQVGRGYAPIGQTPEIQPSTGRVSINYIASISNQGKVRFRLYTQKLTAQVFIIFLERLIAKRTRKLMWIVDRHPVHRSDAVRQWVHNHQDHIEIHYLPPYSPQLNPAEYLNCDCLARGSL